MNNLQIFNSEEFGQMRTVTIDGEPWFVGKDIATALVYERTADAIRVHVPEDDKGVGEIQTPGGKGSDAYKEIGKKVFSECNRDLKRYFRVNARNNVQKKRFNEAIEYVQHWQPCTNTQIAIKECNSQMRFV